jgi:hypothetical protein
MKKSENKITFDKKNYRQHSDKNKRIIEKSLKELGPGRSILLDSENQIIAGNGVYEQAEKQNIRVRVIETNGDELIAVKRNDIKPTDKKRKELALIDNLASDTSSFDMEVVAEDFDTESLNEWEFETEGYFQKQNKENAEQFNEKFPYPITIVVDEKDFNKWNEIKEEMNEPNDLRAFLKVLNKSK